jgi:hypothetical protein
MPLFIIEKLTFIQSIEQKNVLKKIVKHVKIYMLIIILN